MQANQATKEQEPTKTSKIKVPKEVLDKKLLEKEKQVADKKIIKK